MGCSADTFCAGQGGVMNKTLRWLRFSLRRIGILGWVGLMLTFGVLAYAAIVVPQRIAAFDLARSELDDWQQKRLTLERLQDSSAKTVKAVILIPSMATTPSILLALENIARQDGMELKRSEYRYVDPVTASVISRKATADPQGQLVEVRITAPASGNYTNIRAFVAHAMAQQPTLALDGLSLKRESIANGAVQAQLRFTLFVRGES